MNNKIDWDSIKEKESKMLVDFYGLVFRQMVEEHKQEKEAKRRKADLDKSNSTKTFNSKEELK